MKTALLLFASLMTSLTALSSPPIGITVTTTFDYPGTGNSTFAYGINKRGDIAGYYVDALGTTRGFIRLHNGTFSAPIVEPNDTGNFTRAFGINSARQIDGDFFNAADTTYHGFFLIGHTYMQFDFPPLTSTDLFAINDQVDFAGAGVDTTGAVQAYVNIAGTSRMINTPAGSLLSSAHGMNGDDQVVGIYEDSSAVTHGFLWNSDNTIIAPLDYPGATATTPQGINSNQVIVGRYNNADGVLHGYVERLPHTFISFDYPGAIATSFNDISDRNTIAGRYTDSSGTAHGFIAQLR